jgi:hypothetical protein
MTAINRKTIAAMFLAMGMALTGFAGTANAMPVYPDHLVNGGFDYPAVQEVSGMRDQGNWTTIDPMHGRYYDSLKKTWVGITGFDRSRFAWDSSQKDGEAVEQRAHAVEIQQEDFTGNMYAELCADQAGTAIFQNISTVPGAVYRIRLDHASLNSSHLDSMQVLVGPDMGHLTAVPMTRLTSNGSDPTGPVGTTIATTASNTGDRDHSGQWETYQGTYTIPAGQNVTVFTFKSLDDSRANFGNEIDNVSFQIAYPLHYDMNGGADTSGKLR